MRLWIDTDVGTNPDDAVALLCAAAHPDVELVGVSTVDDDTGSRADLARSLVDALVVPGTELTAGTVRAVEPEAVLAIGPLTNVARLLAHGYRAPRLAVMGGTLATVHHRGAVRTVEHNFGSDPDAAAAVVDGLDDVLVCPLDVTVQLCLDDAGLEELVGADDRLGPMCDEWMARQRASGVPADDARVCLHDPLALLALLQEPMVQMERRPLAVSPVGALRQAPPGARRHRVVVAVDAQRARARILALLGERSR
jgi:pyrimidine-specific ribonucleoside hydrolase